MTHTCRCGTHWTGHNTAHCAACHHTFSSPALFDTHRTASGKHGRCLNPATMTTRHGTPVMTTATANSADPK